MSAHSRSAALPDDANRAHAATRARVAGWVLIALALVIVVAPFLWILLNSFKNQISILSGAWLFTPTLDNYADVLFSRRSDFGHGVLTSLIVATVSTAVVLVVATLAAYSLYRLRWSRVVVAVFLGWMLAFHVIPVITLVGPWYLVFKALGLYDTRTALVLTHVAINLPMAVWLMMSFFKALPPEIEEAALVDGCHPLSAFWRVTLPLVTPGLDRHGRAELHLQLERVHDRAESHVASQLDRPGHRRKVLERLRGAARANGRGVDPGDAARARVDVRRTALHHCGTDAGLGQVDWALLSGATLAVTGARAGPIMPNTLDLSGFATTLVERGLQGLPVAEQVDAFCRDVTQAGFRARRFNMSIGTLHPRHGAHSYVWRRDEGLATELHPRRPEGVSDGYLKSPIYRLRNTDEVTLRRRLDTGGPVDFPILEDLREAGMTDYARTPGLVR